MKTLPNSRSKLLRQKAEEFLGNTPSENAMPLSEAETLKLYHELKLHQVELEMQNDELRQANALAKDAMELYDFAPTGYFTLSRDGKIIRSNLYGASMLGRERLFLVNSRFAHYISNDTKPAFRLFLEKVFGSDTKQSCEVLLSGNGNTPMYVLLTAVVSRNGAQCLVTVVDITEQKLAAEKMEGLNLQLESSVQMANMAWWEMDVPNGTVTFSNKKAEMLGYMPGKFKHYLDFMVLVHPEDYENTINAMRSHFEGKHDRYEVEYRILTSSGEYKWFYDLGSIVNRDSDGKPLTVAGLVMNITDRKNAEEEIRVSNSRIKQFFNSNIIGIVIADASGRVIETNDYYLNMIGYSRAEFEAGKVDWRAITPPEWVYTDERAIGELLETGKCTPYEKEYTCKDGSRIDVLITKTLLPGPGEQFAGFILNITKRKKVESALQESELKYRELIENSPDVIVIYSEGNIVLANKESLHLMAVESAEELLGKPVMQFVHPDYHDMVSARMKKMAEDSVVLPLYEEVFIRPDGSEVVVEVKAMPIRFENKKAVQLIISDITERKRVEEGLKKAKTQLQQYAIDLSRQIAEKDKFFSIIAHDLRGPFNGFLGLSELMAEGSGSMSKSEIQNMADTMKKSATSLFRLLSNLLEWSRMQRGITVFKPVPILLNAKMLEIMGMAQEAADKKGISVTYDIPANLLIFADENMFECIFRNLAANAVKYTSTGGSILISAKFIPGDSVEFSIKDTGIGMSKDVLDNLFNIDVNTNCKGTAGELSTGLGLLICKDFIEKHNGTLRIESEQGKGSTFFLTVPGHTETEKKSGNNRPVPVAEPLSLNRKLNILIAEDEDTSDLLISIALVKISKKFFHAKTGIDVIDICRNHPEIDWIMMDIQMPEIDGYEAIREIRRFNKKVIIVAQTAYSHSNDREKSIAAGCNDYISKPISQTELMELIRKYFR